jgi:hypothetical protein
MKDRNIPQELIDAGKVFKEKESEEALVQPKPNSRPRPRRLWPRLGMKLIYLISHNWIPAGFIGASIGTAIQEDYTASIIFLGIALLISIIFDFSMNIEEPDNAP